MSTRFKWAEIYSLAALNAALAISWIAYHEYQPALLQDFGLNNYDKFLMFAKASILVFIPPLSGYVADRMGSRISKQFIVYNTGITLTAIVFMIVASIISFEPGIVGQKLLPVMIVLWLISMNIFYSPANSLLQLFAPQRKLPLAMAAIIFVIEGTYALEPVILQLVRTLGAGLTFFIGGILVGGTGFIFHRVSENEIAAIKRSEMKSPTYFGPIMLIGLLIGLGHALLREYIPHVLAAELEVDSSFLSSLYLVSAAAASVGFSFIVIKLGIIRSLKNGVPVFLAAVILLFIPGIPVLGTGIVIALAYSFLNVCGLPYVLTHARPHEIITAVGIFFGATEIFDAIFEIYLNSNG